MKDMNEITEILDALAWACDNDGLYPPCDVPSRDGCVKEWYEREATRFIVKMGILAPAKRHVGDCMCHDDLK